MTVPVRYYCPRCGALAELERDAYLADRCVTPHPLDGWSYVSPDGDVESEDGVVIECGDPAVTVDGDGCGRRYYLSFVRYERGVEVEARPAGPTREPSP